MRTPIRSVAFSAALCAALLGASVPVTAAAGAPASAIPAAAAALIPAPRIDPHHHVTVKLVKVRCSNTEDWFGDDELITAYDVTGYQQRFNLERGEYEYFRVHTGGFTPEKSVGNKTWANYNLIVFDALVGSTIDLHLILTMADRDVPDEYDILGQVDLLKRPIDMPTGTTAYSQRFRPAGSDYTIYYEITSVPEN